MTSSFGRSVEKLCVPQMKTTSCRERPVNPLSSLGSLFITPNATGKDTSWLTIPWRVRCFQFGMDVIWGLFNHILRKNQDLEQRPPGFHIPRQESTVRHSHLVLLISGRAWYWLWLGWGLLTSDLLTWWSWKHLLLSEQPPILLSYAPCTSSATLRSRP